MTRPLSKYHRHWVQWGNGTGTHAHLLNLIGFNKRVLEIGCTTGYLSRVMQQRGCQVTGVEIDAGAAELAGPFCRRVIVGDVESLDWETVLGAERFDVITFGDVLEHLRAPGTILKQLGSYLAPGGYIVVSLPNVAHGSVRLALLLGRFEYTSLGILDQTHLRFYTKESARQLLTSSGFQIDDVLSVSEPVPPDLVHEVLHHYPQLSPDWIQELLSSQDAQAFQYIFCASSVQGALSGRKAAQMDATPTLSVVISHQGDETGLLSCLVALAAGDISLRQVVVIAESEPVVKGGGPCVEWQWYARQADQGYVQALNEAIASVDGDVVLILDSGFVPQAAALTALARRFKADETVGVVGGKILTSDQRTILQAGAYLAPPVAQVAYRGAGSQDGDARWDDVTEIDFVSPVMMAFRHSLWRSLGGFDKGYSADYFDADFCARVWDTGYRVLVEPKALVISLFPAEHKLDRLVEHHRDRLRFVRQHYGQEAWPRGFFEAELSFLGTIQSESERRAVQLAYLWQLTQGESEGDSETESLLTLYQRAKTLHRTDNSLDFPRLRTHQFVSSLPLVGRLIARLRATWGSLAARWYAESLIQQQNLINRAVFDRVNDLQQDVSELEKLVVWLGTGRADLRTGGEPPEE